MSERRKPGAVRDAIIEAFRKERREMSVSEVCTAVSALLGDGVAPSSVRSYLNINTPGQFIRTGRGTYRLVRR